MLTVIAYKLQTKDKYKVEFAMQASKLRAQSLKIVELSVKAKITTKIHN